MKCSVIRYVVNKEAHTHVLYGEDDPQWIALMYSRSLFISMHNVPQNSGENNNEPRTMYT